ncbi:MAG: hypothetical protein EXX96DRAFT_261025 [Benjaminiella poitrasii]|nr:MAG: hypothetical protein EXX96DRAFT_261025 [Benjaminiella poitrasii]
MDFIHYNPATEPLLADESSFDEMDLEDIAIQYSDLEMIIDFDRATEANVVEMEDAVYSLTVKFEVAFLDDNKQRYKKYGHDQIKRMIDLIQEEDLSTPKAAKACGIPRSSAYGLVNEYNNSKASIIPASLLKKRDPRPKKKLFEEHSKFLIKLFDKAPTITLAIAREKLCKQFEGLEISLHGLHKHITEKCWLSLKNATKYTPERDTSRTIELRNKIVAAWKDVDVDFHRNCVFIDEAGFNSQMMRSKA